MIASRAALAWLAALLAAAPALAGEPADESAEAVEARQIGKVRIVRHKDRPRRAADVRCELSRPVGSHIPRTLCRNAAERARDRAEALEWLHKARTRPDGGDAQ